MTKRSIDDIAYIFKETKEHNRPKPVVLIGAGASITAGIPGTNQIIRDVLKRFKHKPAIQKLSSDDKTDYYKIMGALSPDERRRVFYEYITADKVKINVTHIYLSQLLKEGYVDYILTTNFDDLLLRASSLFNFIPAVYDASILTDFTTTTFMEKSVCYLHGQHHGQWLLNASGELEKVRHTVPKIFERICNNRTWIIIGYSGEDEILDEITRLGSFDNELYWIGYEMNEPCVSVKEKLLNKQFSNAYLVEGYNSDSFFLQLHSELKLHTPEVFNKPFSFLSEMLTNINDIEEQKNFIDLFNQLTERLTTTKNWVRNAIDRFETTDSFELFKQNIIEDSLKSNFENSTKYIEIFKKGKYVKARRQLSMLLNNEAFAMYKVAEEKKDEDLYNTSSQRFQIAAEIDPEYALLYSNWGVALHKLGKLKRDAEIYKMSFKKFERAIDLEPQNANFQTNWGMALYDFSTLSKDEKIYKACFEHYRRSLVINPKLYSTYYQWGIALSAYAKQKRDKILFARAFKKFEKALKLNANYDVAYCQWGISLTDMAKLTSDENTYLIAVEKFKKAVEIDPNYSFTYINWAIALTNLGKLKGDQFILIESLEKYKKAVDIKSNFDFYYKNWGWALFELARLSGDVNTYLESFEKFDKATDMDPNYTSAYYIWASSMMSYSRIVNSKNRQKCYVEANKLAKRAYELKGSVYNLACSYALLKQKDDALKYLKESLEKYEYPIDHILSDEDWTAFLNDKSFKELILKFSNKLT